MGRNFEAATSTPPFKGHRPLEIFVLKMWNLAKYMIWFNKEQKTVFSLTKLLNLDLWSFKDLQIEFLNLEKPSGMT
jgi:hypothetical protein